MELVAALTAGKEAIGLVAAIAELVKQMKTDNEKASFLELLSRMQIEALKLSRDLENRVRVLAEHMSEYNINPAQTLEQQISDLSWYDFNSKFRLKAFREECFSIHRELTSFIDDATALLICHNRQNLISKAFKKCLSSKRDLDKLFVDPNTTIGVLVDGLLATASRMTAELQGA